MGACGGGKIRGGYLPENPLESALHTHRDSPRGPQPRAAFMSTFGVLSDLLARRAPRLGTGLIAKDLAQVLEPLQVGTAGASGGTLQDHF